MLYIIIQIRKDSIPYFKALSMAMGCRFETSYAELNDKFCPKAFMGLDTNFTAMILHNNKI